MRNCLRWERWLALSVLVVAIAQMGCSASRWSARQHKEGQPTLAAGAPAEAELAPQESAKLCLAAAQTMDREGRIGDAIPLYVKARQLDASNRTVCRRLAVLYDRTGNFPQAGKEYNEALRLAPRDATVLNDLGYSNYCQGRLNEAEQYLRKAIEIDPKQDRSWVNLGMVLATQGRYDDGLAAFEKAVPESQAHCNLAFIQTAQGKRVEAANSYRTALLLSPDLPLARGALVKLETAPASKPLGAARLPESVTQTPAPIVVPPIVPAVPPQPELVTTTQPVSYEEVRTPAPAPRLDPVQVPVLAPVTPAPAPSRYPASPQLPPTSAYPRLEEPLPIGRSGFTPMPWENGPGARPVVHWSQVGR